VEGDARERRERTRRSGRGKRMAGKRKEDGKRRVIEPRLLGIDRHPANK